MKNFLKRFISLVRPENTWKRKEFLVVDNSQYADKWGGFLGGTRIVAYKCDEFATLEEAQAHIENSVPKKDLHYIQIYKVENNEWSLDDEILFWSPLPEYPRE